MQGDSETRERYVKVLEGKVERLQEQLQREMLRAPSGQVPSPKQAAAAAANGDGERVRPASRQSQQPLSAAV
jgi:hypothetical protein